MDCGLWTGLGLVVMTNDALRPSQPHAMENEAMIAEGKPITN